MSLFVRVVSDEADALVRNDLMELVTNDESLAFGTAGSDGQPVTYTAPAGADDVEALVADLVASPSKVRIAGRDGDFLLRNGDRLREHAGNTDGTTDLVAIDYDVTLCDGRGYLARTTDNSEIDVPRPAILVNELSEAKSIITGISGEPAEVESRRLENVYRVRAGLPERGVIVRVRCGAEESSGSMLDCFIASAAFGTPLAEPVTALRSFRDDVLLATGAGRDFFERFWPVYYQLSPDVVARMELDPEARELIRLGLVEPIVRLLDLFLAVPLAPRPDLPPPWDEFLDRCLSSFEAWAQQLPVPVDFRARSSAETVRELTVVLCHAFKTTGSRQAYLDQLAKLGQWPPTLTADDRAAIDALLDQLELASPSEVAL